MDPNALKDWLREQGMTRQALADLIGVHLSTVQKWCAGNHRIPTATARHLDSLQTKSKGSVT